MFKVKRIYDPFETSDGYRVLVDRLWPRGIAKDKARIDLWMKEIAPSDALRKWFGHDPERWAEFQKRYREELKGAAGLIKQLHDLAKTKESVTLVLSARDELHNQAVALCAYLQKRP
jgi:uncharacterized protein YeaO (DUF488 family)